MKVLSLTRPWADLVLRHGKDIENRTWMTWTQLGQPLLIHAAKAWNEDAIDFARQAIGGAWLDRRSTTPADGWCGSSEHHPTGIVGVVDLVSICTAKPDFAQPLSCGCGPWAMPGQYHWKLANPRPFPKPIPCRGMPGLFTPNDEVLAAVAAALDVPVGTVESRAHYGRPAAESREA